MNASLVLTALFNGAWQGALLCGLAAIAFRFFRRLNATTMFTVWSALLAVAVLLPFANYAFATKPVTVVVHRAAIAAPVTVASCLPRCHREYLGHREVSNDPEPSRGESAAPLAINLNDEIGAIFRYAPQILLALALVALLRLALLVRDVVRMLIARTRVRPIDAPLTLPDGIARPFRFAASDDFKSPCVLGFAPALIVIPEDLLAKGEELASVVLHEREHVRRFDDVQNVLQRFIGAIAFFCPGVRIALRELALYREQICDDAAVNATGDRISYAMTLTDLAQWAQGRGVPVPSLVFKRKHLLHRLEVLLDSAANHSMRMNRRFALGAAVALLAAAIVVLRFQVPVIAFAAEHEHVAAVHAHITAVHQHITAVHGHIAAAPVTLSLSKGDVVPARTSVTPARTSVTPARTSVTLSLSKGVHHATLPKHQRDSASTYVMRYAYTAVNAQVAVATNIAPHVQADVVGVQSGSDILDALNDAGLHNLSVDQLIALRNHGVTVEMIRAAGEYFGRIGAGDLTYLTDHGVIPSYLQSLSQGGIYGIRPNEAARLMEHGVGSALIRSAYAYFYPRPSADTLVHLADHGVGAPFIESLSEHGVRVCPTDAVRMVDNGVDAAFAAKVRAANPRARMSDIIRLRAAGF